MAWLTMKEMCGVVPFDIYDANGMLIRRAVTGFDPETGEVESEIRIPCAFPAKDQPTRRRETFPAPLMWKKISEETARHRRRTYWDADGR